MPRQTKLIHIFILTGAIAFYLFSFWRVTGLAGGLSTRLSPDCYYQLGQNLVEGNGFSLRQHRDECGQSEKYSDQPTADRPPIYPLFLAGLIKLTNDNPAVVRLLQVGIGVGLILTLYWLGAKLASPSAGLIAAIFLSLGGGLPTFSYLLMSEMLYLSFILICFGLLLYKRTPIYSLLIGALLGLAILTRPAIQFTVPFLLIWVGRYFRNPLKSIGLMISAIALVMAPWVIRNALVFKAFIPTTITGEIAWVTYNPISFSTMPGANVHNNRLPHWEEIRNLPEPERDNRMRQFALEEIARQPLDRILWLFRAKLINFFIFSNAILINQTASSALSIAYLLTGLGVASLYVIRRSFLSPLQQWLGLPNHLAAASLLLVMVFSQFLVPLVFYGDGRYRFGIEPFMALSLGIILALLFKPKTALTPVTP